MFCWRITKYNSAYRDENGSYIADEWTSFSDIGKNFESGKLTFDDYIKIEDAYIQAITYFMDCLGIETLQITDLEIGAKPSGNQFYSPEMMHVLDSLSDGKKVAKEQVGIIVRLVLRENIWCKLAAESMYVHFGYDYYMYIGSKKPCDGAVNKIEQSGLFVEPFVSPYDS